MLRSNSIHFSSKKRKKKKKGWGLRGGILDLIDFLCSGNLRHRENLCSILVLGSSYYISFISVSQLWLYLFILLFAGHNLAIFLRQQQTTGYVSLQGWPIGWPLDLTYISDHVDQSSKPPPSCWVISGLVTCETLDPTTAAEVSRHEVISNLSWSGQ